MVPGSYPVSPVGRPWAAAAAFAMAAAEPPTREWKLVHAEGVIVPMRREHRRDDKQQECTDADDLGNPQQPAGEVQLLDGLDARVVLSLGVGLAGTQRRLDAGDLSEALLDIDRQHGRGERKLGSERSPRMRQPHPHRRRVEPHEFIHRIFDSPSRANGAVSPAPVRRP